MPLSPDEVAALEEQGFIVTPGGVLEKYEGQGGDVVIPDGVTSVGDGAFYERSDVTSVEMQYGVLSIVNEAFCGCTSLVSVVMPASVTTIGSAVFANCFSLVSVNIPVSVTSVNWGMFYGCASLALVVIPGKVLSIGGWAFYGCHSLASIVIPDSVKSIESEAFKGCDQLGKVLCSSYQYGLLGKSGFDVGVVTRLDIKTMTLCLPRKTGSSERWQVKYIWDPRSFHSRDHAGRIILRAMTPGCHRIMFMRMVCTVMFVTEKLKQKASLVVFGSQQDEQHQVAQHVGVLPMLPPELWNHIMSFVGFSEVKPVSFVPLVRALCGTELGEKAAQGSADLAEAPAGRAAAPAALAAM